MRNASGTAERSGRERPLEVFLSYSRRDAAIVRQVELLAKAAGVNPWRDEAAIRPGVPWRISITESIERCDRMMVFWCRHSRSSSEVRKEYWQALQAGKTVAAVLLDRTPLATELGDYQGIDVSGLMWWSHEVARWDRLLFLGGLSLLGLGGLYAIL